MEFPFNSGGKRDHMGTLYFSYSQGAAGLEFGPDLEFMLMEPYVLTSAFAVGSVVMSG